MVLKGFVYKGDKYWNYLIQCTYIRKPSRNDISPYQYKYTSGCHFANLQSSSDKRYRLRSLHREPSSFKGRSWTQPSRAWPEQTSVYLPWKGPHQASAVPQDTTGRGDRLTHSPQRTSAWVCWHAGVCRAFVWRDSPSPSWSLFPVPWNSYQCHKWGRCSGSDSTMPSGWERISADGAKCFLPASFQIAGLGPNGDTSPALVTCRCILKHDSHKNYMKIHNHNSQYDVSPSQEGRAFRSCCITLGRGVFLVDKGSRSYRKGAFLWAHMRFLQEY